MLQQGTKIRRDVNFSQPFNNLKLELFLAHAKAILEHLNIGTLIKLDVYKEGKIEISSKNLVFVQRNYDLLYQEKNRPIEGYNTLVRTLNSNDRIGFSNGKTFTIEQKVGVPSFVSWTG